ncbi:EcsC family protein [Roseomonas gilardii subsp. gilardii]|uniref:EcsC family protein n=1 Tax=Roseomonas gilardii TaxID=257708 RepID=UPI001FF7587F|nr:EcsC family protein [Roseomonas gilardii]UPG72796.1 EcsC family protein [Roseomonas gilardii subsp. gilardii]
MSYPAKYPNYKGNSCAILSPEDREKLWSAACILIDQRGLVVRITSLLGGVVEQIGGAAAGFGDKILGEGWRDQIQGLAEEALWKGHDIATLGLDPQGEREPWSWFNKAIASITGAAGGFFGAPGMAIDIPASTLMIMRSVAEIARAHGEDISSDDGKRACLEVLAFGGPGEEDDEIEVGYWSTRAVLAHTAIEIIIKRIAARLVVPLSEKALAQAVPIAGSIAGGGLNYIFMDYYQEMARVHFTIRSLERKYGDDEDGSVRACFDQLVRQARERRNPQRSEI